MDFLQPVPRWLPLTILLLVAASRIVELRVSERNRQALLQAGAVEVGAEHYPLIVALHASWVAALLAWILFAPPRLSLPLIAIYAALQPLRVWVISTLEGYWTTRVITLPSAPLVRRGPYRLFRHPNYVIVVLEIGLLPLAFGAWPLALIFSILNGFVLAIRIRVENQALDRRR